MEVNKWFCWFESQCKFCLLDIKNSSVWTFWNFKNRKFKTDEHFLNFSQRATNQLMRMKIIDFDMSKRQFTYEIDQVLRTRIEYFDLENSCSVYVKCCCFFAGLCLNLNLIAFWSVKVVLEFFVRSYVLP